MTNYLRFLVIIEVLVYVIYIFVNIFGQFDLPFIIFLIQFGIVTITFITTIVILSSIIEVRDVVFKSKNPNLVKTPTTDYLRGDINLSRQSTTMNILETGGRLIEENSITIKWTCSCGFNNPTSSKECLSCTKPRINSNR
jgi:hypothetical protein